MSNEKVKPTAELRCTETCPSFNDQTCTVCGSRMIPAENTLRDDKGDRCEPATNAIQDSYKASREKPRKQEFSMQKADTTRVLSKTVNELLANGWSLHGIPMTGTEHGITVYAQAMVRDIPAETTVDVPLGDFFGDSPAANRLNESGKTVPVKVKD